MDHPRFTGCSYYPLFYSRNLVFLIDFRLVIVLVLVVVVVLVLKRVMSGSGLW